LGALESEKADDPITWIETVSRELSLNAMEKGWEGPPYNSFKLAQLIGVEVVARQDVRDARLVSAGGDPRIEFNPHRRPARLNFSIAHEIGHMLFEDYSEHARYRDGARRRLDDWQLEMLCNIAAAELLMPVGAFPIGETNDLDLVRLVEQCRQFGVSTEALLRRVVTLTDNKACVFAAARGESASVFRIDYVIASRNWDRPVQAGDKVGNRVLASCTAVGYSDSGVVTWGATETYVQAVGIPPYPGDRYPRVGGLLEPVDSNKAPRGIRYVRGDLSAQQERGPVVIAHIVNDQARRWGGRGLAKDLMNKYPEAAREYGQWPVENRRLGQIHVAKASEETWIASMLTQVGYGPPTRRPRLRILALQKALEHVASLATQKGARVHIPLLGTGQGGAVWPIVRDLVLQELVNKGIGVTVYVLPDARMPPEAMEAEQLILDI
jgi:hypothetical protein